MLENQLDLVTTTSTEKKKNYEGLPGRFPWVNRISAASKLPL